MTTTQSHKRDLSLSFAPCFFSCFLSAFAGRSVRRSAFSSSLSDVLLRDADFSFFFFSMSGE
jgi:hypothetical protein